MSAETLERTGVDEQVVTTTDGDHDKFQHYFLKVAIDANLLEGRPMTALCGKVVTSQADPLGRTVCESCKQLFDRVVGMNMPGKDGRN
jgi:hypothetical protein